MVEKEGNIEEKRGYPRVRKLYLISYINKEEGRQVSPISMGRTLDISASGVRVEVFQQISEDSQMELEIVRNEELFTVHGIVVRTNKITSNNYIIGIQFKDVQNGLLEP